MAFYKKILFVGIIIIAILLSINWALNYWIDRKLPEILSDKNKTPYHITFKDLDVDLWTGNCKAIGVTVVPKASLKGSLSKGGIYTNIEFIEIERINVFAALFSDEIIAKRIKLIQPHINLYKKDAQAIKHIKSISKEIVEPFNKIITVSDIFIDKGDLKIIDLSKNLSILNVENINLKIEGVLITEAILKKEIPFVYRKYMFSGTNFYYRANKFYHLKASSISNEKNNIMIKKFALVPEYGRRKFVRQLKKEKDLYNVEANSIEIKNFFWGFKDEKIYFDVAAVVLNNVSANIFRSKIPPDDMKKKRLYNSLLRSIPFPLKLDTLIVKNSRLVYEEEIDAKRGSGVVSFSKFNLNATHIESGFGKKRMPDVRIRVNCRFMDFSPLRVNWSFNVLDKSDGFKIHGKILNFDTKRISTFFKPYMNMEAEGIFDEVNFNLTGNDHLSRGICELKYHDFKMTIYKKRKPEKKSKLKTFVANLLIKDDSDGKNKKVAVEIKRIPEKSFYNFLWRSVVDGVKEVLLPL